MDDINNNETLKKYTKDIKSADIWSVFRILADFTKGFDELGDLGPSVTIFGSARTSKDDLYYLKSQRLASKLSKAGFNIITGGGPGIMEAANKGATDNLNVESIGLNIDLPHEQMPNKYSTKELRFDYFFSRKVMLVKYSMAYVFFPGGFGTLDELFEALVLVQTRKITGIKIFLVGGEFYKPLFDFLKISLLKNGMITQEDIDIIHITDNIDSIVLDIKESLLNQIKILKDVGLDKTKYYESLFEFSKNKL